MNYTLPNGLSIVNATPHPLTFVTEDGKVLDVPPSGLVITARLTEETVGAQSYGNGPVSFVTTHYAPTSEGDRILELLSREAPGSIVIGSIIAAEAYPGRVAAVVPAPGFERVPPDQRRARVDRFVLFSDRAPKKE